jgi:hypothetical protein
MQELCAERGYIVPLPKDVAKWCEVARQDPSYATLHATLAGSHIDPKVLLDDINFPTLPPIAN